MRRCAKTLLFIFLMSLNIVNLKADCESDKEIAEYVHLDEFYSIEDEYSIAAFEISSRNTAFYVEVSNDYNDEVENLRFIDNSLSYYLKYKDKPVNITVKLYSDSCPGEVLKEMTMTGTVLNKYSQLEICGKVIGGSKLCGINYDTSGMTEEEFIKQVKSDMRTVRTDLFFKVDIKKYYLYALIPMFVIAMGFIIAMRIVKIKRKEEFKKGRR